MSITPALYSTHVAKQRVLFCVVLLLMGQFFSLEITIHAGALVATCHSVGVLAQKAV